MNRFRFSAFAAVALFGVSSVASAADMAVKAPVMPAAAPYSWTGFYAGANVGGGWGNQQSSYSPNDPASGVVVNIFHDLVFPDSFKTSGVLGGMQLGYNYQFGRSWLIGLETDFDGTAINGSGSTSYASGLEISSAEQRIKWFGTLRARLGFLPSEKLLGYFTGGFAYGRVEQTSTFATANGGNIQVNIGGFGVACGSGFPPTCFAGSSNAMATGWTLGGGLEYAISQMWTIKAEYLYVSLGSKSVTELGTLNGALAQSSVNANFGRTNFNVARVGFNYRF